MNGKRFIYSNSIEEKEKRIHFKEKNKKILNVFYPKEKRKEKNAIIKLKYKIPIYKKEYLEKNLQIIIIIKLN